MRRLAAALALALPLLSGCVATNAHHAAALPDAAPYDPKADAPAMLAAAQVKAASEGHMVLAVFGANWCHDSRALAGWLESPEFSTLIAQNYELVFIDAGTPQTDEGRNLNLAARLGVEDITGTPTLLILGPDGSLRNTPEDARSWRNAASRKGEEILATLSAFTRVQG